MKKGGKTKSKVTHVPRLLPPTSINPSMGFPRHSYPCTMACGLELSPNAPLCSIMILYDTSLMTDVPWTCHSLRVLY